MLFMIVIYGIKFAYKIVRVVLSVFWAIIATNLNKFSRVKF